MLCVCVVGDLEATPLAVLHLPHFLIVSHRIWISPIRRAGQPASCRVLCPAFPALDWKGMPPTHLAFLHWFGGLNSGCQAHVTELSPELANVSPTACRRQQKNVPPMLQGSCMATFAYSLRRFSTARHLQITQGPRCDLHRRIFTCPAWGYSLVLE